MAMPAIAISEPDTVMEGYSGRSTTVPATARALVSPPITQSPQRNRPGR